MKDSNLQVQYFHDPRTPNVSGLVFTIVAITGLCLTIAGALIIEFASVAISLMLGFLILIGFVLSITSAIGGIASCLACAGRWESIRGANLSLAAVALGALGIVAPVIVIYYF